MTKPLYTMSQLEATKILLSERYEIYRSSCIRAKAVSVYSDGAPLDPEAEPAALIAEKAVRATMSAEADFFQAQAQTIARALDELDALG